MNDRKDPKGRFPGNSPAQDAERTPGADTMGWEARALAQIRPHVRELSGPAGVQAGWETDTITRLEDYFDRGDV